MFYFNTELGMREKEVCFPMFSAVVLYNQFQDIKNSSGSDAVSNARPVQGKKVQLHG